jgi:hypothetical protein
LHFDTANRSVYIATMSGQGSNMSLSNIKIDHMEAISASDVPADIRRDVTNITPKLERLYNVVIQDSQFVKLTLTQTNSSTDSMTETVFLLVSKIDGKWYYDIFVSYSMDDWMADRSMTDQGRQLFPGLADTTPSGSLNAFKSSGFWTFYIGSISDSNVKYSDCLVTLTIGGQTSSAVSLSSMTQWTIYINAGPATGYTLTLSEYGASGTLNAGDELQIGPLQGSSGLNAVQADGTQVTLTLKYKTGGTIATGTIIV